MPFSISHFVRPEVYESSFFDYFALRVAAIVPTYKPGELTVKLVEDILRWNSGIHVYVVDDCTPESYEDGSRIFSQIAALGERVTLMRTPVNRLKAGALNYALRRIFLLKKVERPQVVVTLDDDVVINQHTIRNLVIELVRHPIMGAVCSQSLVYNRTKNLLTRIQSLEYQGFNATRLADEGFFGGPLVMHGMLTAFKTEALREVEGFKERHLIEDYEITARLKEKGWHVKSAVSSYAWTLVPETLTDLWKQRTRWSYGGMVVVAGMKRFTPVIQDVIGHSVFIATILLINALLFFRGEGVPHTITNWIIGVTVVHLVIWYGFQIWLMRLYREKDSIDWIIRMTLVPEFVYSNIMTLVLIGSYLFFGFNMVARSLERYGGAVVNHFVHGGRKIFLDFGYTDGWGTRTGN